MNKFLEFFKKNKVLITGLISAVALAAHELITQKVVEPRIIVLSCVAAALSFMGKNLRGQWQSIVGVVGVCAAAYLQKELGGYVNWWQTIMGALIAYGLVVGPPPKSIGYERTQVIEEAKEQGEAIQHSVAEPPAPPEATHAAYMPPVKKTVAVKKRAQKKVTK